MLFRNSIKTFKIKCRHWSLVLELSLQLGSSLVGYLGDPLLYALPGTQPLVSWFVCLLFLIPVSHPDNSWGAYLQTVTWPLELGCPLILDSCLS